MPIYEYHCPACDHDFETLVRGQGDVPRCPKCKSVDLSRLLSVPAAIQAGGASAEVGPAPCGPGGCGSGMCSFD